MNDIAIVAGVMLLIWTSLLIFFVSYAHEVSTDPCTVCAERKGEEVVCTTGNYIPIHRTYYPNGSIYDDKEDINIKRESPTLKINVTDLLTK